jgi:hypothetical protein
MRYSELVETCSNMTFLDIRDLAEKWCDEVSIDRFDIWTSPDGVGKMTVTQWLFNLHERRDMTIPGMRLHFDRNVDAIMQSRRFVLTNEIVLSEDLWAEAV